jgi:hypothetical protein
VKGRIAEVEGEVGGVQWGDWKRERGVRMLVGSMSGGSIKIARGYMYLNAHSTVVKLCLKASCFRVFGHRGIRGGMLAMLCKPVCTYKVLTMRARRQWRLASTCQPSLVHTIRDSSYIHIKEGLEQHF